MNKMDQMQGLAPTIDPLRNGSALCYKKRATKSSLNIWATKEHAIEGDIGVRLVE